MYPCAARDFHTARAAIAVGPDSGLVVHFDPELTELFQHLVGVFKLALLPRQLPIVHKRLNLCLGAVCGGALAGSTAAAAAAWTDWTSQKKILLLLFLFLNMLLYLVQTPLR